MSKHEVVHRDQEQIRLLTKLEETVKLAQSARNNHSELERAHPKKKPDPVAASIQSKLEHSGERETIKELHKEIIGAIGGLKQSAPKAGLTMPSDIKNLVSDHLKSLFTNGNASINYQSTENSLNFKTAATLAVTRQIPSIKNVSILPQVYSAARDALLPPTRPSTEPEQSPYAAKEKDNPSDQSELMASSQRNLYNPSVTPDNRLTGGSKPENTNRKKLARSNLS